MRTAALLLLAATLGLAVGRSTAPERSGRREEWRAPPFEAPRPPANPPAELTGAEPSQAEASEPRADPREGTGFLEVSTAGAPKWEELSLEAPSLRGEWDRCRFVLEEPLTQLELPADRYRILARAKEDLSPRTWEFVVEPGATVRVDLAAAPVFPIPAGLGRLDFAVYAMDGGPLADARLVIRRLGPRGGEDGEFSNPDGRGRLHLVPGHYLVAMGAQHRGVHVEAGSTAEVVFRYAGEGEVVFEHPDGEGRWPATLQSDGYLEFVAGGERPHAARVRTRDLAGSLRVYVRPGRYRVHIDDRCEGRPPIGEIDVRPGSVVRFGRGLPSGSLAIHVTPTDFDARLPLEITMPDGATFRSSLSYVTVCGDGGGGSDRVSEIAYLPPGRYRVRFVAEGWEPAAVEVDVGEDAASVTLETRPSK